MANIQLKIRTLADNDTEINSIKNTGNSVTNGSVKLANSEGFFATIPTADFAGQELLTFAGGALQFTSNGMLANGSGNVGRLVDESDGKEFIWGVVPESKKYFVEVQLSVSDLDLTAITLYGDSVAQQYPTEVIVNGQTYQNDDVVLTIPVNTNSTQINVKMTKWKRANYNACLTKIAIFAGEIQLENRDIKSLESLSQSTGQPESIFYGCVPSSGSASINDRKGEFYDYIKNGVISNSNSAIDLFVNGKKVQTHIATDSDYDLGGRVFSLDLENKLSLYDNIMYEGYPFDNIQVTLYDLFSSFCSAVDITAEQKTKMLSSEIIYGYKNQVGTVADYFRAITIRYPYIERGTVRETLDKFCTLAQLNLIEDDNGDLIFVQARPIRTGSERVLVIPAKNQMSSIDRNIIVKNVIDKAVVAESDATTDIKTKINIGTVTGTNKVGDLEPIEKITKFSPILNEYIPALGIYEKKKYAVLLRSSSPLYYEGTFSIPRLKDKTLVTNVYDGISEEGVLNVKCNVVYNKRVVTVAETVSCEGASFDSDGFVNFDKYTITNKSYSNKSLIGGYTDHWFLDENALKNELTLKLGNDVFGGDYIYRTNDTNIATATFSYNEETDSYDFHYKVLAARIFYRLIAQIDKGVSSLSFHGVGDNELYGFTTDNITGADQYYISDGNLKIDFFGDTITLEIKNNDVSAEKDGTHTITVSGNELLQSSTKLTIKYNSTPIANQISNNIVTDYANGVSTCRVTVTCGDYADEYGVVRKNWAKGEIFQVGDIVRLDKDNDGTPAVTYKDGSTMLWKITGRNLRHEGVSLLDLELQEIF